MLYRHLRAAGLIAVLTSLVTSGRAIRSVVVGRDLLPEHQGFE